MTAKQIKELILKECTRLIDEAVPAGDQGCYISQVDADCQSSHKKLEERLLTLVVNLESEQRDIIYRADRERGRIVKLEQFRDSNPVFLPDPDMAAELAAANGALSDSQGALHVANATISDLKERVHELERMKIEIVEAGNLVARSQSYFYDAEDVLEIAAITWERADVHHAARDLFYAHKFVKFGDPEIKYITDEQAADVLHRVVDDHDATIGVSWETLEIYIEELLDEDQAKLLQNRRDAAIKLAAGKEDAEVDNAVNLMGEEVAS